MAIEMMSISHYYCSDYMTKTTQFGDEPVFAPFYRLTPNYLIINKVYFLRR